MPADASLKTEELSALFPVAQQSFWQRSVDSCGLSGWRSANPNAWSSYTYLLHTDLGHIVTDHHWGDLDQWYPPGTVWSTNATCVSGTEQPDKAAEPEEVIGLNSSLTAGEMAVSKGHTEEVV